MKGVIITMRAHRKGAVNRRIATHAVTLEQETLNFFEVAQDARSARRIKVAAIHHHRQGGAISFFLEPLFRPKGSVTIDLPLHIRELSVDVGDALI